VSAAPEFFTPAAARSRDRGRALRRVPLVSDPREERLAPGDATERYAGAQREQRFWQWFAVGVLLFCWIAEATMCAVRGF
jgi:hypothetical protein